MHSHCHCHCNRHMDNLIEQNRTVEYYRCRTDWRHRREMMDSMIDSNILQNAFDWNRCWRGQPADNGYDHVVTYLESIHEYPFSAHLWPLSFSVPPSLPWFSSHSLLQGCFLWFIYSDAKEEYGRNFADIHQPRHASCEFCATHSWQISVAKLIPPS